MLNLNGLTVVLSNLNTNLIWKILNLNVKEALIFLKLHFKLFTYSLSKEMFSKMILFGNLFLNFDQTITLYIKLNFVYFLL